MYVGSSKCTINWLIYQLLLYSIRNWTLGNASNWKYYFLFSFSIVLFCLLIYQSDVILEIWYFFNNFFIYTCIIMIKWPVNFRLFLYPRKNATKMLKAFPWGASSAWTPCQSLIFKFWSSTNIILQTEMTVVQQLCVLYQDKTLLKKKIQKIMIDLKKSNLHFPWCCIW